MRPTTRIAGAVAGVTLALGSVGALSATAAEPQPCAQQQKQVDKAEVALEKVTAVFQNQQSKVKKAKHEVKVADSARERANAKADLAQAKEKRDHVAKAKTAQQQRLAKAQERLDTCEAGQPAAG
jgi:hypothetical protein